MRVALIGLVVVLVGCGDDDAVPSDAGSGGGADATVRRDATVSTPDAAPFDAGPFDAGPPPAMTDRVVDHDVTWTFSAPVLTGRYITGDPWIVCPATVTSITPAPGGGRNGSVLNLPPVDDRSGFDDRTEGARFDSSLVATPPIMLAPGDSLASSASVTTVGVVDNWLREGKGETSTSAVQSVSVLTCVDAPPPSDAFRPSYGETSHVYRLSQVNRALIPRLAPPSPINDAMLREFADRFSRPWIDNLFFGFDAQVAYMPMYGREVARATGIASLLVMLDLPVAQQPEQERLLVGLLQRGIDLAGLVRAGHPGWSAFGGHGSGRKWPIIFAGMVLGDTELAEISRSFPSCQFGEDMHTAFTADLPYGPAWNGATVVYTGHQGVRGGMPVSSDPAWGPYEHLPPGMWLDPIGESYRRCCTSLAWVGEALAAREMDAQTSWGHDAFFAYVDRWMDPTGDAMDTQAIFDASGHDFRAAWAAQGQTWDGFVQEMWTTYR